MQSKTLRLFWVGTAIAALSLLIPLAACSAEIVDSPATPAPTATASATPFLTSALLADTALPPTEPPPAERSLVEHVVQAGDTLLGLAMAYDVPMAAIQLQNGMGDSTIVRVGQTLSIPPRYGWEGASHFWIVRVVRAGETLGGIAQTYGLQAADLEGVNGLSDADLIWIGQELVLPVDAPAVALAPTSAPTDTPLPSSTPTLAPAPLPISATLPPVAPLTPTVPAPTPTLAPAAPPPADIAEWPNEIIRLINEARAQYGLPPLAYNETLAQVAQAHANDCLQRGWGSHTGSDGSNVKTRMERAGYDPARWSECWAHMQSPQAAMNFWMNEEPPNDPHRRTILSTWLTEVGAGVVQPEWGYYFFADFGTPRD
jgi:uncharacterized protein YkwD